MLFELSAIAQMRRKTIILFLVSVLSLISHYVNAQEVNYLSGRFINDTLEINGDTVYINGEIEIGDSSLLVIHPGSRLIFTGPYEIKCAGGIQATGTKESPVYFTQYDTLGFHRNDTSQGGWKGITLTNKNAISSFFKYCVIEYAKKVTGPYGVNGGAIRLNIYSDVIIDHCIIRNNKSRFGGGIFIEESNPTIKHSKIYNNQALEAGGGIYCYHAQINISNCLLAKNSTLSGGGIYFQDCEEPSNIINNTITENVASVNSGGIYIDVSDNITIRNTIIYFNYQLDDQEIYYTSDTLNINVKACNMDFNDNYPSYWGYIPENPLFVKNNSLDFRLRYGSPCIDKGLVVIDERSEFDIDGRLRVWDGDGDGSAVIDIGAYEFDSPIPPKITYSLKHPQSFNASDGEIDLTVLYGTPPFSFKWNVSDTTEDLQNLRAGLYEVKLTDSYNLTDSLTVVLDYVDQTAYSISGTVFTDDGYLENGVVISYSISDLSYNYEKGCRVIDGKYHLNGLYDSTYLLFALPSLKSEQYYLPSFYYDKQEWSYSFHYDLIGRAFDVDFYLPRLNHLIGPCQIVGQMLLSDTLYYDEMDELSTWLGYISPEGNVFDTIHASNIPVVLFRDDEPFGWALTDTSGNITFSNLPQGKYQVMAQVPGRPMVAPPDIIFDDEYQEEHNLKLLLRKNDIISYISGETKEDLSETKIYPNPVREILTIDLNIFQKLNDIEVEFYTKDGRLVHSQKYFKPEDISIIEIPVSTLLPENYLLKLKLGDNYKFFKVVKL